MSECGQDESAIPRARASAAVFYLVLGPPHQSSQDRELLPPRACIPYAPLAQSSGLQTSSRAGSPWEGGWNLLSSDKASPLCHRLPTQLHNTAPSHHAIPQREQYPGTKKTKQNKEKILGLKPHPHGETGRESPLPNDL